MNELAIYGAGGLGRQTLDILLQDERARPVAFLDSDATRAGTLVDGLPVLGGLEQVYHLAQRGVTRYIVAIGDNFVRVRLARQIAQTGCTLVSAIHPSAKIAPSVALGEHLIIGAHATICVHALIGAHSVVSSGAIVDHDNQLAEGVFLHPAVRLAGGVRVESFAQVGIGAAVIPGRVVGREAIVDPGAVVIRDVPPRTRVGGVPAQTIGVAPSRFRMARPTRAATLVDESAALLPAD